MSWKNNLLLRLKKEKFYRIWSKWTDYLKPIRSDFSFVLYEPVLFPLCLVGRFEMVRSLAWFDFVIVFNRTSVSVSKDKKLERTNS